jgi:SecD/SecF fusion protein
MKPKQTRVEWKTMQRNYLRGLLVCLIPCLVAAVFAVRLDKYRLGIDLAGGTILVYEINLERTKQRKEAFGKLDEGPKSRSAPAAGLTSDEMNQLAGQIKRRIDPTDIKNVTVRPLGDSRVEIILPVGGAAGGGKSNLSAEDIEEVKRLISQMGVLEFRILANGPDDSEGIIAAQDAIKTKKDDLDSRAERGLAPEGPDSEYSVDIGDTKAKVRYVWVELGPEERVSLRLNNASEAPGGFWDQLAKKRGQPVLVDHNDQIGYYETQDVRSCKMVLFSRVCISRDQLAKEKADSERLQREKKTPEEIKSLVDEKKFEYFVLTRVSADDRGDNSAAADSLRVGGDITLTATSSNDPKTLDPCVSFTFNGPGAKLFGKITRRNKPSPGVTRHLAILLDDRIVSAPSIQSEITSQGQITGKFDRKSVDRLVQILRSGALSAELREKPVSENTIGPTLGADTIRRGTTAVGLAFVAILAFMLIYYRFAGIVACVALFANLLLTIGFMVAVNAAFTLPGLAGLVLTLGMAVDANVLIYERLREERNKGANLITAIRNGYDRAFPTIIDTHLTSIFTAIVLYTLGNDNLKGFAISLTVGLIISLFSSLYMTRLVFDFWQHKKWLSELRMMRLFEKPNFHPMKYRYIFFSITGILTILGLALFLYRGEAGLNVDFRGGTVFAGRLKDNEERALTATSDGKLGFRELLDEKNQERRLGVEKASWENKPSGGSAATVNTFIYTIKYKDGTSTTVTLSHKPNGNTEEEMDSDVAARASHLPDVSVEQMFLSGESYSEGKSRYFTIRTTEKQAELVQASLDRLLRDENGKSLMNGAVMNLPETKVKVKAADGKESEQTVPVITPWVKLTEQALSVLKTAKTPIPEAVIAKLSGEKDLKDKDMSRGDMANEIVKVLGAEDAKKYQDLLLDSATVSNPAVVELEFSRPTSRSFVQELLEREFRMILRQDLNIEPFTIAGIGVPTDGRFTKMKLDVSRNPAFDQIVAKPADAAVKNQQLLTLQTVLTSSKRAFDSSPEPERLEVFDTLLASETRTKALWAILASWLAILLYLWFRFLNWTFGAAAVICLIHDLCFTLGAIAVCHYLHLIPGFDLLGIQDFKIDMASVAALLTLVGYSVSDTIVVFDRIREVRGKNPKLTQEMINDSVNQTLSRTILTAATVFLVSFVLYAFGGEGVHLFAFVMVMGVLVGTYSSVFVAAPLLLIFGEGHEEGSFVSSDETTAAAEVSTQEEVVEG